MNKKNKQEVSQQEKLKKEQKVIQDLINIKDVQNGLLYTKDNYIIGYIRVMPVNISLLSKAEKKRKMDLLKEKLNEESEYEFLKLSKSVDLSQQLNYLQNLAKECDSENSKKKFGLLQSIRATSRYSQQGEMVENQYYYMFRMKNEDNNSEKDLRDKLFDFINKLQECEIKAYLLEDMEIVQVANLFCNPVAYEDEISIDPYVATFLNE